tara:strand:+ start:4059 stop:4469 length:411 start_codon:yes stop_codon:yes gene_type:complete
LIDFAIDGKPLPLQRHRSTRRGIMYDPSKKDKVNFLTKCLEFAPKTPLEGALWIEVVFSMPRPKSHYRTGKNAGKLKDDSPTMHTKKPDLDNLVKFVCDALDRKFYLDDSQITRIQAVKVYAEQPSTEITIIEDYI